MNGSEFSRGFDTLLASYSVSTNFGSTDNPMSVELDEFEKSQFLTAAQEEEVISLYNGKNSYGEGFEQTEELRRYLAPLIEEVTKTPDTGINGHELGVSNNHKFFTLPEDCWFITYEAVRVSDGDCSVASDGSMDVYPVRQDEYHKIKRNPFRGANNRRALRLDLSDGVVEIVSKYNVIEYYVRYLRKPKPIIISDLDGMTINGYLYQGEDNVCELPDSLHQRILERAVVMALQSKGQYNKENK